VRAVLAGRIERPGEASEGSGERRWEGGGQCHSRSGGARADQSQRCGMCRAGRPGVVSRRRIGAAICVGRCSACSTRHGAHPSHRKHPPRPPASSRPGAWRVCGRCSPSGAAPLARHGLAVGAYGWWGSARRIAIYLCIRQGGCRSGRSSSQCAPSLDAVSRRGYMVWTSSSIYGELFHPEWRHFVVHVSLAL